MQTVVLLYVDTMLGWHESIFHDAIKRTEAVKKQYLFFAWRLESSSYILF